MTKLSALAIVILLLLGAAMWYTANLSFPQYVKETITYYGYQLTKKNIDYASFIISPDNKNGMFRNIEISDQNEKIIVIENITFQVNKEKHKQPMVIIDKVIFSGVSFTDNKEKLLALSQTLKAAKIDHKTKPLPTFTITEIQRVNKSNTTSKIMTLPQNEHQADIIEAMKFTLLSLINDELMKN